MGGSLFLYQFWTNVKNLQMINVSSFTAIFFLQNVKAFLSCLCRKTCTAEIEQAVPLHSGLLRKFPVPHNFFF